MNLKFLQVFEKFWYPDLYVGFSITTGTGITTGSGFGLFTVQERIRNIQGDFTIASEINVGTTINFFIPLSNDLYKRD